MAHVAGMRDVAKRHAPFLVLAVEVLFVDEPAVVFDEDGVNVVVGPGSNGAGELLDTYTVDARILSTDRCPSRRQVSGGIAVRDA